MDSFADSCVIINLLEFNPLHEIKKRCYDYFTIHKKNILLCTYVLGEIKMYIKKKEIIYNEVIRKKKNPNYQFGTDKEANLLKKEETLFVNELYRDSIDKSISSCEKKYEEDIRKIRLNLNILLKRIKELINQEVDEELVKILREFIEDYADCKILSIALQIQQTKDIFTFFTADSHLDPNGYEFLKGDIRIKDMNFPVLKNLLFEKS